jgi:site-specific recombinase
MTVATKQPAMTAQTLAGLLGDLKPTRSADLERMVDVVAAVSAASLPPSPATSWSPCQSPLRWD